MPSAANYTNKIRFAASVKNTKAQLKGGIGNLTQTSIAGCGLNIQYTPIEYIDVCECKTIPPPVAPPVPPLQLYINTVAGIGIEGYSGDGGPATESKISAVGMCADRYGNVYIADTFNNRIRKVSSNGIITTIAGNGVSGYSGDGGLATNARLNFPWDVCIDIHNNIYICEQGNCVIRKIDTSGIITTIAGNGVFGYSGDGGLATNAKLNTPQGVAIDSSGNIYIADTSNNRIRKVDTGGIITTIAGNGVKGYSGDGGQATLAKISLNYEIFSNISFDMYGTLYIADTDNNRIRKVDISGIITTIAGDGTPAFSGDGGLSVNSQIKYPNGITVSPNNTIYFLDNLSRVRKLYYA